MHFPNPGGRKSSVCSTSWYFKMESCAHGLWEQGYESSYEWSGKSWPTRYSQLPSDNGHLTHRGRVTQICVFNTVKLGTSASSP